MNGDGRPSSDYYLVRRRSTWRSTTCLVLPGPAASPSKSRTKTSTARNKKLQGEAVFVQIESGKDSVPYAHITEIGAVSEVHHTYVKLTQSKGFCLFVKRLGVGLAVPYVTTNATRAGDAGYRVQGTAGEKQHGQSIHQQQQKNNDTNKAQRTVATTHGT